jgi:SSS family solute:Na+ symporter
MHTIDIIIFALYILIVLGIGFYFHKKNETTNDYYTGGNDMGSLHIGLSVVATDVGGGFSIGLGGLGFAMGLSGSWMLFTGLVGAWLSAVLLIPKVIERGHRLKLLTFPQLLLDTYGKKVALLAGIISFIGYLGFTSSQLLAGAKLAVGTFPELNLNSALLIMGVVAVGYTVFGGIKAVIYTDTFQWILLMGGLIFIGLPLSYFALGGYDAIVAQLPADFLSLRSVSWIKLVNWFITIVPIWFVGMTLYQRIYACRDERTAKRAWYIAGLFEYPVMAFMGVLLGLFARVAVAQGMFVSDGFPTAGSMDSELGLPLLLRHVLPAGLTGLMLSAYFSAIMSTADSCLLAASGNFMTDLLRIDTDGKRSIRISQWTTLGVGAVSLVLATAMTSVLDLMLMSYAFMVAGLLVPVLAMLFKKDAHPEAAFWSMLTGGGSTILLTILQTPIPFGFDPILIGIILSGLVYVVIHWRMVK